MSPLAAASILSILLHTTGLEEGAPAIPHEATTGLEDRLWRAAVDATELAAIRTVERDAERDRAAKLEKRLVECEQAPPVEVEVTVERLPSWAYGVFVGALGLGVALGVALGR